jgi:hypothetical protein
MHADAEECKTAFATQGIIDSPQEQSARAKDLNQQPGQEKRQPVDVPGSMTEEAMKARPVAVADIATGEDDLGNKAMSLRQGPASEDLHKRSKRGYGEDKNELT